MTTLQAIILHTTKYNDRSSIIHFYAKDGGRMAAIVYGNKKKLTQFAPLSYVEISLTKSKGALMVAKEISYVYVPKMLHVDLKRHAVAIFISEILFRSITHPLTDNDLFEFIVKIIYDIDNEDCTNQHIIFLLRFADYMGIAIDTSSSEFMLDLFTAEKCVLPPAHKEYLNIDEMSVLNQMQDNPTIVINRKMRQNLLYKLCRFYELQIEDFVMPKSLDILEQVFD